MLSIDHQQRGNAQQKESKMWTIEPLKFIEEYSTQQLKQQVELLQRKYPDMFRDYVITKTNKEELYKILTKMHNELNSSYLDDLKWIIENCHCN